MYLQATSLQAAITSSSIQVLMHSHAPTVGCYRSRLRWRLGTIDPRGFIMVCIPSPCLPSARIKGGSVALPHSWAGSWGSELAEGLWVLPPKHCSRRGCPCPSAPHPDRNHPKPQPQEVLCLSGSQLGLFQ